MCNLPSQNNTSQMTQTRSLPGCLLLALSLAYLPPAAHAQEAAGALELDPCHLSSRMHPSRVAAECGRLAVPENWDAPDGKQIELEVAVLRSRGRTSAPDALAYITGGPGQSALESWIGVAGAFNRIRRERDVLLVDQRGTGQSNRLQCEFGETLPETLLDEPGRIDAVIRECLDGLPGDPRFYTTSVAIRDLDAVRSALGYPELDLYGVSYGTRVVQAYMRRYPERVRTAILDGVVPQDLALGPDISLDAQRALEMMFQRCEQDAACNERFPQLEQQFDSLLAELRDQPVELVLQDPVTAELTELAFNEAYFTGVMRMFSYAPETVALLPLLIDHAVRNRDFAPLAAQALMVNEEMTDMIALGMHNAVVCTEDVPFAADLDARRDDMSRTYLGTMTYDFIETMCSSWPPGFIDDGFKEPVESDIPTLLLSGEADPVTPPANGEHVAAGLSNSLHLVGKGQGHGMAARGCTPGIMAQFVATGSVDGLETDCLERLKPAPFFMRFTGPEP